MAKNNPWYGYKKIAVMCRRAGHPVKTGQAYRTPTQLGLLERMHKTIKEEEVYWRLYENPDHAQPCLNEFRQRYNHQRPHWALIPEQGGDPVTPEDVYIQGQCIQIPKWQKWAREAKKKLEKSGYMEAA